MGLYLPLLSEKMQIIASSSSDEEDRPLNSGGEYKITINT
jgi:hypothetical protein